MRTQAARGVAKQMQSAVDLTYGCQSDALGCSTSGVDFHMLFPLTISEYSGHLPGSCGTAADITASSL